MRKPHPRNARLPAFALVLLLVGWVSQARAMEAHEAGTLMEKGEYAQVIKEARAATQGEAREEVWFLLLTKALLATGQYAEARKAAELGLTRNTQSVQLRLVAREAARQSGDPERAAALLQEIDRLGMRTWAYQNGPDQVALGRAALLLGADPKGVKAKFYDPWCKPQTQVREAFLAAVDLALDKGDYATASSALGVASRYYPGDPEVNFAMARTFVESDAEVTQKSLGEVLAANPHHLGALLLLAERHLDAERYDDAATALDEALKTNPASPEAHALRAVLTELNGGDAKRFTMERAAALKPWPRNPDVEHLIGRKLSQHYRFAEGAAHQRKALEFDSAYLPAKLQLAEDLLRLGDETEGWKLAAQVQASDPYDIVAYNLVTLQEKTSKFAELTSEHFLVRMPPEEAAIYGPQVLALLEKAHAHLCAKYGLTPAKRTTVEIFSDQKDFAIRTFGLPGGAGYLGVCFGNVITANGPMSRPGSAENWESVLWHEFAHVVTLGLTKNRMPRWLSEGISVYEERQARGNWGERMKPRYRAMILNEDFVPLSQLSGAFLKPKTPVHLMFAYYESSLAVEFLTERYGVPAIKAVCADLAAGKSINAALAQHCAPIAQLDAAFAVRAKALAQATGPKLDWSQPGPEELASAQALGAWMMAHPDSYVALTESAKKLLKEQKWEEAKAPLHKLIELYPEQHESDSAYVMLARAHRELGETEEERKQLEKVVKLSSNAVDAQARLMELAAERKEWAGVLGATSELAAINPLLPKLYQAQAEASVALGKPKEAITAYETLLKLDENAPPDTRFKLAREYRATGQTALAKQRLLEALEESPRNREGLKALLEMQAKSML